MTMRPGHHRNYTTLTDVTECVADLTLENRLLKKSMIADGGDDE